MNTLGSRFARRGLVPFLTGALALSTSTGAVAQTDTAWLGMNVPHYSGAKTGMDDLGVRLIRIGAGWGYPGAPDDQPRSFDENLINSYVSAGYTLACSLNPRGYDLNNAKIDADGISFDQWVANYKAYCKQVITKYGSPGNVKIAYYICGNEPDLADPYTGNFSPQQIARFTRALYEAKNEINAALTVESSPPQRPDTTYLRDMIEAGVADYCDVIGIHAYSDQFNDSGLAQPWNYLAQFGKKKPVVISEAGVPVGAGWAPSGMDENYWRKRWHNLAYVQAKRMGIDKMFLYTNSGYSDWTDKWDYRDRWNNFAPIQPVYDEVKFGMIKFPNINGGFENNNDRWREWVLMQPINQAWEPNWANFASSGAASGARCLKISAGGDWRTVKRVIPNLKPGSVYRLSVKARVETGSTAYLFAQGYNRTAGTESKFASTASTTWTTISATFLATNPWVVASLECSNSGTGVYFDDVTVSPIIEHDAVYKFFGTSASATGRCLDVEGVSTANDARVQIWDSFSGSNNQKWRARHAGDGLYQFIPQHATDKAMTVQNSANANGAAIVIWTNVGGANQKFSLEDTGNNQFKLVPSMATTRRVDLVNGGISNGTKTHLWDNLNLSSQKWTLVKQ